LAVITQAQALDRKQPDGNGNAKMFADCNLFFVNFFHLDVANLNSMF